MGGAAGEVPGAVQVAAQGGTQIDLNAGKPLARELRRFTSSHRWWTQNSTSRRFPCREHGIGRQIVHDDLRLDVVVIERPSVGNVSLQTADLSRDRRQPNLPRRRHDLFGE